jgi:hypothetical protein
LFHKQPYDRPELDRLRIAADACPTARQLADEVLSLPMGPQLGTSKNRSQRRKPVFSSLISLDSSVLRNGKSGVSRGAHVLVAQVEQVISAVKAAV